MDSVWGRLSQLFSIYAFALIVCGVFNWFTGCHTSSLARDMSIRVKSTGKLSPAKYLRMDQMPMTLAISSNFDSVFSWNAKQVFVMATATYETPGSHENEVVIWDYIVEDGDDERHFNHTNLPSKYYWRDPVRGFAAGQPAEITLRYQYMPHVGLFRDYVAASADFTLSSSKVFN